MATATLDSIYTHFKAGFKESPDFAIDCYEKNAIVFDTIKTFATAEELKYFIELNWHYINALFAKDHYNQAIDEANAVLPLIDSELIKLNASHLKNDWYYGIFFLKGMAHYKLRNYKEATPVFKALCVQDTQNDLYHKWHRSSKYGQRLRLINMIWSGSAIILLFVLFFEEFITSIPIKIGLTTLGFLGIAGNLVYEFYSRRSYRKKSIIK